MAFRAKRAGLPESLTIRRHRPDMIMIMLQDSGILDFQPEKCQNALLHGILLPGGETNTFFGVQP